MGELPQADAKIQYIILVSSLSPDWDKSSGSKGGGPGGPVFSSLSNGTDEVDRGISVSAGSC